MDDKELSSACLETIFLVDSTMAVCMETDLVVEKVTLQMSIQRNWDILDMFQQSDDGDSPWPCLVTPLQSKDALCSSLVSAA